MVANTLDEFINYLLLYSGSYGLVGCDSYQKLMLCYKTQLICKLRDMKIMGSANCLYSNPAMIFLVNGSKISIRTVTELAQIKGMSINVVYGGPFSLEAYEELDRQLGRRNPYKTKTKRVKNLPI